MTIKKSRRSNQNKIDKLAIANCNFIILSDLHFVNGFYEKNSGFPAKKRKPEFFISRFYISNE